MRPALTHLVAACELSLNERHHTLVQVILRPGEVLKEEWVVTGRGVPAARVDGSPRDGEVCLDKPGKYRVRAVLAVQDMDRSGRKRDGASVVSSK